MHRAWDRTLVGLSQPLPCVLMHSHAYSLGWSGWLGQWNGLVLDNSLGASDATLLERKGCSLLVCSCFSIYWMLLSCHYGVCSMVVGGHRTISDSYCLFRSFRRYPLGCLCSWFHAHANLPLIPSFPSLWMSFWFLISLCSLTHCFGYPSLITQPSLSSSCYNASFLASSHHQIYLLRGHGCNWSPEVFPRLVSSSMQHHCLFHQLVCWALFMVAILLCTVPCWKTVCLSYHVKEWLLSHGCPASVSLENQCWARHPATKWKVPTVLQLGGGTKTIRQWQCLKEAGC